jgi:uncharacterized protein
MPFAPGDFAPRLPPDFLYNTGHEETMSDNPKADPILIRFRAALRAAYGDRLERVVLYGSRARGDYRPDSDYDIAVFIKHPGPLGEEIRRLASITSDISLDTDAVICALPFRAGAYRERTGFMHEIRQDGIDL